MDLPAGFAIRCASTADLETLVAHRRAMFQDMGYDDDVALDSMSAKFRPWLLERMKSGEYRAWVVSAPDSSIAAGAGLWLMDWPPHMIGEGARRGNILNVYTNHSFRRRGLARLLMEAVLPREPY
jgi:GNAT superfamily N-acetyltransferase